MKVHTSVGQIVPDASTTLSKTLRRGQYTSGEARMLHKSLSQFLEQSQEELADAEATTGALSPARGPGHGVAPEHDAGWSGTKQKSHLKVGGGRPEANRSFSRFENCLKTRLFLLVVSPKSTRLQSHPHSSVSAVSCPSLSLCAGRIF